LTPSAGLSVPQKDLIAVHSHFAGQQLCFPFTFKCPGLFEDTPFPREMFVSYCNSFKDTEGEVFQFLKKELAKQMLASEEKVTSNNLRIRQEREEFRLTMKTAHLNRANADLLAQHDSLQLELDNMRSGKTNLETQKVKPKSEKRKKASSKPKKEVEEENFDAEDWGYETEAPVQLKKRVKTLRIIGPSPRESPREWSTQ
jgi:hypothetical protein